MAPSRVLVVLALALASCFAALEGRGGAPAPTTTKKSAVPVPVAGTVPALFPPQPPGKRLAIVYTASVQGYVEPCGCTGDPLGGVARLAAAIDDAKAAFGERVLFVDAGDLLFEKANDNDAADQCQADARARLLLSTYARKGLAATTIGPKDDVRGAAWRDERIHAAGITTIGARGKPFVVVDRGGVRVAIVAFRVDDKDDVLAVQARLVGDIAAVQDQNVDVVVALAQANRNLAARVLTGVRGLDAAILGRAPEAAAAPERIGASGPLLVTAGMQAQNLGVLEFVLDGRATVAKERAVLALDDRRARMEPRMKLLDVRIGEYEGQLATLAEGERKTFVQDRLAKAKEERAQLAKEDLSSPVAGPHVVVRAIALARGMAEETTAAAGLVAYDQSVPTLVARCEATLTCAQPAEGQSGYVGADSCRACHPGQARFWDEQELALPGKDKNGNAIVRKLSHARAWTTLVDDHKERDRSCIACHSTGFMAPGGFCKSSEVGKLAGVQCEACHGPGSRHAATTDKALIRRDVDEQTCRGCHHVPHIPTTESFVLDERLLFILGPEHGKARYDAIKAKRAATP